MEIFMPITVNNPAVDKPSRQLVVIVGVGIAGAIAITMREAIDWRSRQEPPINRSGETTRPVRR